MEPGLNSEWPSFGNRTFTFFDSSSETRDRVTYEISPNEYEFKNATRDIINGLEAAVGQ